MSKIYVVRELVAYGNTEYFHGAFTSREKAEKFISDKFPELVYDEDRDEWWMPLETIQYLCVYILEMEVVE